VILINLLPHREAARKRRREAFFGTLGAAAVLGLSHVVADWLAALIVGGIVSIVGFVMINSGKNKFDPSSLKPERTQRALQQDKEMVERRMQ